MQIGIIGSGDVGKTLADGFVKHGHTVTLGTRDVGKLAEWQAVRPGAAVASFDEAAEFGEIVVLAVGGAVALDALALVTASHLDGKTIIDATNPIANEPPVHGVLPYFTTFAESLMEKLQAAHPKAHFVKAFNSVGAGSMVNPEFVGGPPTMFICGNDPAAKKQVEAILDVFGWETADMGPVEAARAIEPLCILWCIPGIDHGDWSPRAFKLLR